MKSTRYETGMSERALNYFNQMTWPELWDYNAEKYPSQVAIVTPEARVTWLDTKKWTDNVAVKLVEMGFKKDEIIGLQLPNIPEAFMFRVALKKAGLIGFVAGIGLRQWEMEQVLTTVSARGIAVVQEFHGRDFVQEAREFKVKIPGLEYIFVIGEAKPGTFSLTEMAAKPASRRSVQNLKKQKWLDRYEVQEIRTTSGTTGLPKILEFLNDVVPNGMQVAEIARLTHTDVCCLFTPHVGGVAALCYNTSFVLGAKLVTLPNFEIDQALQIMQKEKANFVMAVPTQLEMMVNHPDLNKYDLSSLKVICYSGAVLSPLTATTIEKKLNCKVIGVYGGMEFATLTTTSPDDPEDMRRKSVGRLFAYHDAKIVNEKGDEVPMSETGELLAKTPNTGGIYKDKEATLAAWSGESDGWFHTGDLAKVDEKGYYYIVGRIKDVYKRGGWTVAPAEIESILVAHHKIRSVAIVGMPDPMMGEKGCAYVILKPGQNLTFDEMVAFLKENKVATYKIPERLEIVTEFPMSSGQKVLKRELIADITKKLKAEGKIS